MAPPEKPAQLFVKVLIDRPVRLPQPAETEVVAPPAQSAVESSDHLGQRILILRSQNPLELLSGMGDRLPRGSDPEVQPAGLRVQGRAAFRFSLTMSRGRTIQSSKARPPCTY